MWILLCRQGAWSSHSAVVQNLSHLLFRVLDGFWYEDLHLPGTLKDMKSPWLKTSPLWVGNVCVSVRYPRAHNTGIPTTYWKQPEWKQVCGYKFKRVLSFFHWECRPWWYISLMSSFSCRLVPPSDWGSSTSSILDSPRGSWDPAPLPYLQ